MWITCPQTCAAVQKWRTIRAVTTSCMFRKNETLLHHPQSALQIDWLSWNHPLWTWANLPQHTKWRNLPEHKELGNWPRGNSWKVVLFMRRLETKNNGTLSAKLAHRMTAQLSLNGAQECYSWGLFFRFAPSRKCFQDGLISNVFVWFIAKKASSQIKMFNKNAKCAAYENRNHDFFEFICKLKKISPIFDFLIFFKRQSCWFPSILRNMILSNY